MNEIDTFVKADQRLAGVVDRIPDDRWAEQVPSDFPTFDDGSYTFRQILDYQAYDEAWIPDMMAGRTIEDVGGDSYGDPHGSDLLDDAPAQRFRDLTNKAIDAVTALKESDLDDRTVHYSYGDYSAREALWHAIVLRAMRSYDISKAVGIDSTLRTTSRRRPGTSSNPTPRSGARWRCSALPSKFPTTHRCRIGCSGSPAGDPDSSVLEPIGFGTAGVGGEP